MDDPIRFTFGPSFPSLAEAGASCGCTRITIGGACFDRIGQLIHDDGPKTPGCVVVFFGRSALRRCGFLDRLLGQLAPGPVKVVDGIGPNPTIASCQEAADALKAAGFVRTIIAVGGGSVMDTSKVANVACGCGLSVANLLAKSAGKMRRYAPMLLAVPTTAGSGSEVTPFATVWDFGAGKKHSLEHPFAQPTHAVLDARLTVGMDQDLTLTTACDALGHAMESLWSKRRTPISQAVAVQAMTTIVSELPKVMANPIDLDGRARLQWASLLGGLAISQTRTAAAHAISYALTLRFAVPHGRAVGLLLPHVLAANLPRLPPDRIAPMRAAFGVGDDDRLAEAVAGFLQTQGLNETLASYQVQQADVRGIAEQSTGPSRLANNIAPLSRDQIEAIITSAL